MAGGWSVSCHSDLSFYRKAVKTSAGLELLWLEPHGMNARGMNTCTCRRPLPHPGNAQYLSHSISASQPARQPKLTGLHLGQQPGVAGLDQGRRAVGLGVQLLQRHLARSAGSGLRAQHLACQAGPLLLVALCSINSGWNRVSAWEFVHFHALACLQLRAVHARQLPLRRFHVRAPQQAQQRLAAHAHHASACRR